MKKTCQFCGASFDAVRSHARFCRTHQSKNHRLKTDLARKAARKKMEEPVSPDSGLIARPEFEPVFRPAVFTAVAARAIFAAPRSRRWLTD